MFLFCNEDKKKKERLNSVLKTTHNLIKKKDIKDVRKNPVYSLIRAMSNYHLYDIVRELYEDEEVTDVQSIYKDIGEYLINSDTIANRYRYTTSFGSSKITEELHSLQRITRIVFSSMLAIMESVAGSYIPNRKLRLLFMTVSFPQIFYTIQQVDNSCKHISVFDM